MDTGAREHRALARCRTLGQSVLLPFGRLQKGVAVRAKPPAAVTAEMDMYTLKNHRLTLSHRGQARSHRDVAITAAMDMYTQKNTTQRADSGRERRTLLHGMHLITPITLGLVKPIISTHHQTVQIVTRLRKSHTEGSSNRIQHSVGAPCLDPQ